LAAHYTHNDTRPIKIRHPPRPTPFPYTTLFRSKPSDEISLECSVRESSTNFHFEGKCESCDAHRMSRLTLGGVEDRYYSGRLTQDRKSTRLNSSHVKISYAVFCLKKKNINQR